MSLRLAGLALVASSLSASTVADARLVRINPPVPLAGDYDSTYGKVLLAQQGNRIHGVYQCCGGGSLDGQIIENRMVKFHWREPRGAGEGEGIWRITNGRLEGSWGHGQSNSDGGPWNLWRDANSKIAQ